MTNVYTADILSVILTGLEEGTEYIIQLSAFTSAGTGPANSTGVSTLESGMQCLRNSNYIIAYDIIYANTYSTEW